MGNFIQQILGFLTSPVGFIIIFGLIGGLGKLGNWLSHERAKRAASVARTKREQENLRTGRPITVDSTLRPAPAGTAQGETQADRQRALQEQRAAQLRALQQKRLEELRAKRAAQQGANRGAGGAATARRGTSQGAPSQAQSQTADAARAQPAQHSTTRRPAPPQRMQPPQRAAQQPQRQQIPPQSQPQQPRRDVRAPAGATPPATRPVETTEIGTGRERQPSPYQLRAAPSVGLGPLLGSGQDLRRAVVLAELLGPPVADRDPDSPGMF